MWAMASYVRVLIYGFVFIGLGLSVMKRQTGIKLYEVKRNWRARARAHIYI